MTAIITLNYRMIRGDKIEVYKIP